jgi:glycosyltransferase involved in cell wall biosynthesis
MSAADTDGSSVSDQRDTLMVIVLDQVSDWIRKGEVVDRYFNPGNVFRHIDLVLANRDRPDPGALQRMAGDATIEVHNFPSGLRLFLRTAGWRPWLLRGWASGIVDLAHRTQPRLIRCHGVRINALAAAHVRAALGIPVILSVHSNPDIDQLRGRSSRRDRFVGHLIRAVERKSARAADVVVAVYWPIVPYLEALGVRRHLVLYNVVGHGLEPKSSYDVVDRPLQALCVGRQQSEEKDPMPIVEALAKVEGVELHMVGDGDLHDGLRARVDELGITDRVRFSRALPNEQVLEELASSDLFVYSSSIHEVSKTCIEAALAGLPLIVNDRDGDPALELTGGHVRLVSGTRESYALALEELRWDESARRSLGLAARAMAEKYWEPERTEELWADLYREIALPDDPAGS